MLFQARAGGKRLQVVGPGGRPRDLVSADLDTSLPAAAVGDDRVAFFLGREPERKIVVATVAVSSAASRSRRRVMSISWLPRRTARRSAACRKGWSGSLISRPR